MMSNARTLAFAPVYDEDERDDDDQFGSHPDTFIDLEFVPYTSEDWDTTKPNSGVLRLWADGRINFPRGLPNGITLTQADIEELQRGVENPGYW